MNVYGSFIKRVLEQTDHFYKQLERRMASELDVQIEKLRRCEIITEKEVKGLCEKAREILMEEANVQRVDAPVTVSFFLVRAAGCS